MFVHSKVVLILGWNEEVLYLDLEDVKESKSDRAKKRKRRRNNGKFSVFWFENDDIEKFIICNYESN